MMKVKLTYPRHVVGGHFDDPPTPQTKTGPRLKYWILQAGHKLVKKFKSADVILNFGRTRPYPDHVYRRGTPIINDPFKVATLARKQNAICFLDMWKLNKWFPKTWDNCIQLRNSNFDGRVIIKPHMGRCGNGKKIYENKEELLKEHPRFSSGYFVQELIPISSEFRVIYVHHSDSDYFGILRKSRGEGEIRNHKFGWKFIRQVTFQERFPQTYTKITRLTKLIADLVGVDYVGMDIGTRKSNLEPIFIEGNTCTFMRDKECVEVVKLIET